MRKIRYFIFILISIFALNLKLNALTCEYSDGSLSAKFTIDEKKGSVSRAEIKGRINTSQGNKGYRDIDETEPIANWSKIFEPGNISSVGQDYYINFQKCPQYSFLVDRQNGLNFAVTTQDHLAEFEEYGKSKQGYAIMPLVKSSKEPEKDGSDIDYEGGSCAEYTTESACKENHYFACVWNVTKYGNFCNTDNLLYIACGNSFDIPNRVPEVVSLVVNILKIATPIILIIVSIISLLKSLAASKEDEIKKAQTSLIKRIIAAILVFFVVSIVQFVIIKVADRNDQEGIDKCLNCFLNNNCEGSIYYKTNVGGTYICKYLESGKVFPCEGNK